MYKLWKRVLSIVLTLSTLLCLLPPPMTASGLGYGSADDNAWGDEVQYYTAELPNGVVFTYTDTGKLTKCVLNGNTTVDVPETLGSTTIRTIGGAFKNCVGLTSVTLPNTIRSIYAYSFKGCTELSELVLPDSILSLSAWAFADCPGLTSITLSNQLTEMDYYAFENCTSLTSIAFPESMREIGGYAFSGCSSLSTVEIPVGVTKIYEYAFSGCNLTSVNIPETVTSLGERAFQNCANLSEVVFMGKDTVIEKNAFAGSTANLTIYGYSGSTAQTYAQSNGIPFVLLDNQNRTLSVAVHDPAGTLLNGNYQVYWYDSEDELVSQNKVFYGADAQSDYCCVIALDENLSMQYKTPDAITVTPEDDSKLVVTLEAAQKLNISGLVTDAEGTPMAGAQITVEHLISDAAVAVTTDENGSFLLEFFTEKAVLTVGKDGYYTSHVLLDLSEAEGTYDVGTLKLRAVVADRIALDVFKTPAVKTGEQIVRLEVSSLKGLNISVSRENGEIITDYEIQGNNLIFLPDVVAAGETLTVSVVDASGEYATPVTAKVVLDTERVGSADLQLVQKGSVELGTITGLDGTACLFDSEGNCVWTASASNGVASGHLDAGTYTLVLMEKTNLLRGLANLSVLDAYGLTAGADYFKQTITIRNGSIAVSLAADIVSLDPNKFGYLVDEETFITVSKPAGLAPGEQFMVRVAYKLDSAKGAVAQNLKLMLPEGVILAGDSIALVNNFPVNYSYDEATQIVSVPVSGVDEAVIHLYCRAGSVSGTYSISAGLSFDGGALQSVGDAPVKVMQATISMPRKTRFKTVTAIGITVPNAQVSLFVDDDEPILTTANDVGNWSIEFELDAEENKTSYHCVSAQIDSELLPEPVYPKAAFIAFDSRFFGVESFHYSFVEDTYQEVATGQLSSGASERVAAKISPDGKLVSINSAHTTIYFDVKIAGDTQPKTVYVKATSRYGDTEYVKLSYMESKGIWGGHKTFGAGNVPVRFNVAYTMQNNYWNPITDEIIDQYIDSMNDYNYVLAEGIDDFYECVDMDYDEERDSLFMSYTDYYTKEKVTFAELSLNCSDLEETSLEALERDGFIMDAGVDGIYPRMTAVDNSLVFSFADINDGTLWTQTMDYSPVLGTPVQARSGSNQGGEALLNIFGKVYDFWSNVTIEDELNDFGKATRDYINDYKSIIDNTKKGYNNIKQFDERQNWMCDELDYTADELQELFDRCADNMSEEDRENLQNMINAYRKRANDFRWRTNLGAIGVAAGNTVPFTAGLASVYLGARGFKGGSVARGLVKKLPGGRNVVAGYVQMHKYWHNLMKKHPKAKKWADFFYKDPYGKYIKDNAMDTAIEKVWDNWQKENMKKLQKLYDNTMSDAESTRRMIEAAGSGYGSDMPPQGSSGLACGEPEPIDDGGPGYEVPKIVLDPSGYVYEAVPSNRVEGVTASIYYKDEDGDPVLWDAEEYNQINNQITGADGAYHWDVPVGEWKVTFSKEGYLPADTSGVDQANESGWLPVPPPQLNINVGIVSKAAPKVELTVAYDGQLEIQFSQYMNINSVKNAISLTRNGNPVSIQVAPMDAEYDLKEENQYATRFVVIPSDGNTYGQMILSVSADAMNYAGTAMGNVYTSDALFAQVKPTGISCPASLSIGQEENYMFSVTLEPCVANQTLLVESQLDFVAEVVTPSVTTDENGRAVITVKGLREGTSWITITEPVSGLRKNILVNTEGAVDDSIIQPVVATLEDGTVVTNDMILLAGTKVFLATQTEGADIRYTLNNTCPCKADALLYTGPIVLTEDTMLRAAAWKDDLYSATIKLNLNVRVPTCDIHTYGQWVEIDDESHQHTCDVCGNVETANHVYSIEGEVLIQPTVGAEGQQEMFCQCGAKTLITLPQMGDFNGDGKVNMKDWNRLYEYLTEVVEVPDYAVHSVDLNGDGKFNVKDWNRLYEHLGEVNPL